MTEEGFKRKLTAILSADVEGYSRLMGEDEDATIRTLTSYRELMTTLIQKHRGRVVDSPGDNLLAEFTSVVDAVRCAVEVQEELRVRNAELPENRRMEFRIGINLGDVVQEGERIYGDGVNITARVEGLAEGGGICISGTVYDSIKNKLSLSYESLGEHTVKNITEPVRVYRMRVGPEAAVKPRPRYWQRTALAALVVLIVAAGAWAIWNFYFGPPPMDVASVEKMAFPLPEKPSVAVLPFTNMSGDPEQEYIADGITENIITALSKVPDMFVIARNSTFTYKGKPVKVQQIAEELSVQYVLEGSVQKSESRLRITVQLVDAIKGRHVWAERYDRDLKDIFALQDEITMKVIAELQVELTEGDKARRAAKGTNNLEAYLKFLKANQLIRYGGKEKIRMSRKILKEVIALDPEFPMGYLLLGWTHSLAVMGKWSESPKESMARAKDLFQKGLELDDSLDLPHRFLGAIYAMSRQWDRAVAELERAVSIAPYSTNMWALANALKFAGRPEEAIAWYKKAFRLDPITSPGDHIHLGMAYFMAEQFENALAEFKRVLEHSKKGEFNPIRVHRALAATYAMLGREEEARNHAAEVLRINPKFSLKWATKRMVYKKQADIDRYVEALRKAGLK